MLGTTIAPHIGVKVAATTCMLLCECLKNTFYVCLFLAAETSCSVWLWRLEEDTGAGEHIYYTRLPHIIVLLFVVIYRRATNNGKLLCPNAKHAYTLAQDKRLSPSPIKYADSLEMSYSRYSLIN